jgi:drug/metabolite transporter (DMT)-like permease
LSSEKIARSSDQSVAGPAVATGLDTNGENPASDRRRGAWLAILAVLFFSTSPVLVRLAEPLSAYEKTAGRLAVAALALLLVMRLRREPFRLTRRDLPLFIGIGLIAALHFVAYVASLSFTTIAHSLAIVYTAPIFVALFSAWFLHEPIRPRQWLGVLVAVLGVALLAGFEPNWSPRMAVGDLLALLSAIMFGLYSVAGRQQRSSYPLFTYAVAVYGLAALWVLPAAAANFTPAGYTLAPLLAVLALGIIPLGIGHTLYNAALRHTHATTANLIATQEVTLGILLGALLLGEMPKLNEMAGALVTLLGIVLVLL